MDLQTRLIEVRKRIRKYNSTNQIKLETYSYDSWKCTIYDSIYGGEPIEVLEETPEKAVIEACRQYGIKRISVTKN